MAKHFQQCSLMSILKNNSHSIEQKDPFIVNIGSTSTFHSLINKICPNGVAYKKLGDVCCFINGRAYKQTELLTSGKYKVLRVGNFYTNDKWYYSNLELDDDKYCNNGDLLFTWAATLGAHIWNDSKTIFHYHIWKLDYDKKLLLKKYLYYFLNNDVKYIQNSLTQSTMPHVSMESMEQRRIPVPPLPVQKEIVRILDMFSELTTELTTELAKRKQQYQYYRDSLLQKRTNSCVYTLGDIASFSYGFTDKAKDNGDARFIRITDITDTGCLMKDNSKFINISKENKKYIVKKGDLLMARTGATYAKTLYYPIDAPAIYASFLIKITPNNEVLLNRYYWHFAQSTSYWYQANNMVSKGGQPQFNSNVLRRIKIPVPPLAEQERIVAILDRFDALCNELTSGLPAEIEARKKQYEYYRDKLLTFKELSA